LSEEDKMKRVSIFMLMVILLGLAVDSLATSPMPEEVMPGPTADTCAIRVTYSMDRETGVLGEEVSSTLTFAASMPKKDVLEKIMTYVDNKLREGKVSEFKVECKFPKRQSF
jgi:hypothetical protein